MTFAPNLALSISKKKPRWQNSADGIETELSHIINGFAREPNQMQSAGRGYYFRASEFKALRATRKSARSARILSKEFLRLKNSGRIQT
jgi:hypothetical protein